MSLPWIEPCIPTLVDKPPTTPGWVHEIKWDGYRVSAYLEDGRATVRTRRGHDWTTSFPAIAVAIEALKVRTAIIDGEAVVLDDQGRSSFSALKAALSRHGRTGVLLYAFDLLFLDGKDLRSQPLTERRQALASLLRGAKGAVRLSEEYAGDGAALFARACEEELEGIVSKRVDRPYRSGVSRDWVKTKCVASGIFTVIGYEPSATARGLLGKLLLAIDEPGGLRYIGGVGTGFSAAVAAELKRALDSIRVDASPVKQLRGKGVVWTQPALRAEVAYRGWTSDGHLRHASFKGIIPPS